MHSESFAERRRTLEAAGFFGAILACISSAYHIITVFYSSTILFLESLVEAFMSKLRVARSLLPGGEVLLMRLPPVGRRKRLSYSRNN
jgi:hypothetical protein